ncbi:fibronectin type III domain-containing protein [uncultured Eubacterium sp.]|uniref:fibronectin type III domain-containing protein n=1 Tax=uncultured Eubacterium sp. TaxID=165185 RepID=UPI0025DAF40E|nr:fibronectin type III domain-containing protein [uncultured Eubacterium sp.]
MKKFISLAMSAVMFFSSVAVGTVVQAGTVEDNLRAQGFSESYIEDLAALQKAHPNWKFVAFKTGLDFDDAVKGELAGTPTTETNLRAYLDPRNWLNEKYIFQFESIKKSDAVQSVSSVNAILKNTWMANSKINYFDTQGISKTVTEVNTYADAMIKASNDTNMSANYIAAKIRQENGGATYSATAVCGTRPPFQGIFNYFNIGAYTTAMDGLAWAAGFLKANKDTVLYDGTNATASPIVTVSNGQRMTYVKEDGEYYRVTLYNELGNGKYEDKETGYIFKSDVNTTYMGNYGRPWTDPNKAIYYGAKYIANGYLTYQYTMYLQKFNVNAQSGNLYRHEYMTNVSGAASEGYHLYSGYSNAGLLNSAHTFYIPVFNNMPNDNSDITTTAPTTTTKNYTPAKVKLVSLTAKKSGHNIVAKWNKCSTSATGYQIYWAKDKKFKKVVAKTTTKGRSKVTYTGKNFTKGRKYYVRIRAYKKAGGKTYYGAWSNIKAKTAK